MEQNLNKEEFEVYDRQLRLWGFEAQAKMKVSRVLVLSVSPITSELSRHLVLSGINLTLVDTSEAEQLVQETDYKSNFLLSSADKDKPKGQVLKEKLLEMNPYCDIKYIHTTQVE